MLTAQIRQKLGGSNMARLDHALIYQVAKLATGANAHSINTCLYRYEKATNSKMRARYECVLRNFIITSNQLAARRAQSEFFKSRSKELSEISNFLAQKITDLAFR